MRAFFAVELERMRHRCEFRWPQNVIPAEAGIHAISSQWERLPLIERGMDPRLRGDDV